LVAARVLERKCGVRERRVAANRASRARVLHRRPDCLRHGHKRPKPVEHPSLPQRASARQVLLLASKAAARPRARARARQRLRGSVLAGPAARGPVSCGRHPLGCKQDESPEAWRQKSDRTGSRPGVALVRALTAKQALDNIPNCRVVGAGVRQHICRERCEADAALEALRRRLTGLRH